MGERSTRTRSFTLITMAHAHILRSVADSTSATCWNTRASTSIPSRPSTFLQRTIRTGPIARSRKRRCSTRRAIISPILRPTKRRERFTPPTAATICGSARSRWRRCLHWRITRNGMRSASTLKRRRMRVCIPPAAASTSFSDRPRRRSRGQARRRSMSTRSLSRLRARRCSRRRRRTFPSPSAATTRCICLFRRRMCCSTTM